jgi:alkyl hydroperoxide reductase subunit F
MTDKPTGGRYDLLIIGGGPAAVSAAIYAVRKSLNTLLVAKDLGGQVAWTSKIENYPGFTSIEGRELAVRFQEQLEALRAPMLIGEEVNRIATKSDAFTAWLASGGTIEASALLIATGKSYRKLSVPGEDSFTGRGVAYCVVCDAPLFARKRVIIAGGGNSAFTAAIDLLNLDASVTMINILPSWQADELLIARAKKRGGERLALLDHAKVLSINGQDAVTDVRIRDTISGRESIIPTDGIFVETGLIPNSGLARGLVEINDADEIIVDNRGATSMEGIFAAGDVTNVPGKQIITAAGEGAKASLAAYDYLMRIESLRRGGASKKIAVA